MEMTEIPKDASQAREEETRAGIQEEAILNLPQVRKWDGTSWELYHGFWYPEVFIEGLKSFQHHFRAHDSDVLIASAPKAGTTWLKALTFSIVNRTRYSFKQTPLLTNNPHDLIPFLEFEIYMKCPFPDLENLPCPRIFATHSPYVSLPSSIKSSNCKMIYIARNPLDLFISFWHFRTHSLEYKQNKSQPISLDELFNLYCQGFYICGPIWDHVLGYWNASIEKPNKVLFLKYEDMKDDIIFHTKRLAEFLGFPFSVEEETQGLIEEITKLCSFENLKNLEVNKTGRVYCGIQSKAYFRKGKVGNWADFLSPSMGKRMEKIMDEKLAGSGLTFQM